MKLANLKNSMDDSKDKRSINKQNIITINIFFELSNVVEYIYTLTPSKIYNTGYSTLNNI